MPRPLARAPEEELRRIDPAAVVGVRPGAFGAEALILRSALPGGMVHQPATLEDLPAYAGSPYVALEDNTVVIRTDRTELANPFVSCASMEEAAESSVAV